MPNWTDNRLFISAPAAQAEALCAALEGPADWVYPIDALGRELRQKELSHHEKLRIDANLDTLIAEFHERFKDSGWPDWMKPGFLDLVVFDKDPEDRARFFETVPFSIPALRPWKDAEDFHTFFPEEDPDSRLWSGNPKTSRVLKMRECFISVKWPPSHIKFKLRPMGERIRLEIKYTTPWSPIGPLPDLLSPTLRAHGAKALLKWVEEQGYCGFQYMDPCNENPGEQETSEEFADLDTFLLAEKDEDGDEHYSFDSYAFNQAVADRIDDADFDESDADFI